MMGADYYQTDSEIAALIANGEVPIGVGQNTKIMYVFLSSTIANDTCYNLCFVKASMLYYKAFK